MPIELLPHNQEAVNKVMEKYKSTNKTCVVHPTSTGKSYIALKIMEELNNPKVLYLAPRNQILHQIRDDAQKNGLYHADTFRRMSYTKLAKMSYEEIKNLDVDFIVADEFQHGGSPVWGAALQVLMDTHPNAKVLGLSATPVRYFDGYEDMCDVIFDGNVASEITFEEAFDRGILKPFKYVAAVYTSDLADSAVKDILNGSYVAEENKGEFIDLFNKLKSTLDNNIKNLPDMLAKNMPNKSGKYVFFCKNVEDKEKMKELALSMFSKVNKDIEIYDIDYSHSDRENQNVIKKFRNAPINEGALKILFNVDMLIEGFQVPGLAGGFTTRPTQSPRIAFQEVGRILSVDKGITPVFIDFADSLRQLEVIEQVFDVQKTRIKNNNSPKISSVEQKIDIVDHTVGLTDIINQMKKQVKDRTSMDEKIAIIKEFIQESHGDIITAKTEYKGHPIGNWVNEMKSLYKNGKLNQEVMEKIELIGLFDVTNSRMGNIENKIKMICEYAIAHPEYMYKMSRSYGINVDEVKEEDREEIERFNKEYMYIYSRWTKDKIDKRYEELMINCGVGGCFKKYIDPIDAIINEKVPNANDNTKKFVKSMIKKYGSWEEFEKNYVYELKNNKYFSQYSDSFIQGVNISEGKYDIEEGFIRFINDIKPLRNKYFTICKSEEFEFAFEDLDEKNKENLPKLKQFFGIFGEQSRTLRELKKGYSASGVRNQVAYISRAFKTFANRENGRFFIDVSEELTDWLVQQYIKECGILKNQEISLEKMESLKQLYNIAIQFDQFFGTKMNVVRNFALDEEIKLMKQNTYGDSSKENSLYVFDEKNKDIMNNILERAQCLIQFEIDNKEIEEQIKSLRPNVFNLLGYNYTLIELLSKSEEDIEKYIMSKLSPDKVEIKKETMRYMHELKNLYAENGFKFGMTKEEIANLYKNKNDNQDDIELSKVFSKKAVEAFGLIGISKIKDFKNFTESEIKYFSDYILNGKNPYEGCNSSNNQVLIEESDKYEKLKSAAEEFLKNNENIRVGGIELLDSITLKETDLSIRSYNCLCRAGIKNLGEFYRMFKDEEVKIKRFGKKTSKEVLEKCESILGENYFKFEEKKEEKIFQIENNKNVKQDEVDMVSKLDFINVAEADLSIRAYNCLCRAGIKTLGEFYRMAEDERMEIRNLGKKSYGEIMEKCKDIMSKKVEEIKNNIVKSKFDLENTDKSCYMIPLHREVERLSDNTSIKIKFSDNRAVNRDVCEMCKKIFKINYDLMLKSVDVVMDFENSLNKNELQENQNNDCKNQVEEETIKIDVDEEMKRIKREIGDSTIKGKRKVREKFNFTKFKQVLGNQLDKNDQLVNSFAKSETNDESEIEEEIDGLLDSVIGQLPNLYSEIKVKQAELEKVDEECKLESERIKNKINESKKEEEQSGVEL